LSRVIIIEDEKPAARRLQRMLQKEGVITDVLLHSVNEALQWFARHPAPDLIFADIQLTDGLSFDIFEQIELKIPIIFTTAYDQYAIKAFKLNSIDYLLKPIKQDELQFSLNKFRQNNMQNIDMQNLIDSLKPQQTYKHRFTLTYGQHIKSIPDTDIAYFVSQDKTTYLVTHTGESFIYDSSLETLQQNLNPTRFFRVNRRFIIAFDSIKDMIAYSNSRLKVLLHKPPEQDVIVARERVKDFKRWLG